MMTATTTTNTTTTTTTGVPSSVSSSVSCTYVLNNANAAFTSVAAVATWADNQLAALCATAASVPQTWISVGGITVSSYVPASKPSVVHTQSEGSALGSEVSSSARLNQLRGGAFKSAASASSSASISAPFSLLAVGSNWLLTVNIVIRPISSNQQQQQVDGYATTLVSALNTAGSTINKALATQSVTVLAATVSTPTSTSSSSDFFSTPWHQGVVATVIIVVVLLMIVVGACLFKRRRNADIGRSAAKPAGKYEHQLEDMERHKEALPSSEAEGDAAVQMTDVARLNASADSDQGGETGHDHDGKAELKLGDTDSEVALA
jgi:hypothetical protein